MKPSTHHILMLGASALALAGFVGNAAAAAVDTDNSTIAEVIVTAQKRSENLQKVPIAVAVVGGDQAAAQNLNDLQDISSGVPSVDFRTSASNKDRTIFVRGVGTISTSPGVEPSVSTVIDGVVMARAGQSTVDFSDVDHVEVLEGPQGTLFGKNATAGVINIVTKAPSNTLGGHLDAGYYTGNEFRVAGGVSGPINEHLRASLSAFTSGFEGNVTNLYDHKKVNGYRHSGARGKLVAEVTDKLTVTVSADYTASRDTTPNGVWVSSSKVAYPTGAVTANAALATAISGAGIAPSLQNHYVNTNLTSRAIDANSGASVQTDYDLSGGFKLTTITAIRSWRNVQYQDFDALSAPATGIVQAGDTGHLRFSQTSEEVRVASPKGQFIDYVAGLFYMDEVDHETYERDDLQILTAGPFASSGLAAYGSEDVNGAVFGEANVNFTNKLRLIVGGRVLHDRLTYYHNRVDTPTSNPGSPGIGANYGSNGGLGKQGWTGRIGLQYDVTDRVNVYGTVSRGYMGPAYNVFFNMGVNNIGPLNPETSNSYEVGMKGQFFDRRLQADIAAFITDFDNYQANFTQLINGAQVTNLINAGSVTSRGVSGDVIAKVTKELTLNANIAYDDAHIVNFPCPANAAISCNINGQPLPFAPEWKMHYQADYRRPVTAKLDLDLETDYNWQSKTQYQLTQTPNTIQPSYGLWNASLGLIDGQGGWSAHLVVKNITDQQYSPYLAGGNIGGLVRWVARDDRRYFGVNLHRDF